MLNLKLYLKAQVRFILDIFMLIYGIFFYNLNKAKPMNHRSLPKAHLSMIRLFCRTRGWSNDFLSKCHALIDKPLPLLNCKGILGDISRAELAKITQAIESEGYYLFEKRVPPELVKKLYDFAATTECRLRPLDNQDPQLCQKAYYNREAPKSSVYDIPFESSFNNPDVRNFLQDNSILGVAQSYLKTSPKIDYIAFWWSTAFSKEAQSNSAQMFHFDMDRLKWIKVFVFLTDVTLENGPHVFVSKSHRSGNIPKALLKGGYVRHADSDVYQHYPSEDIKTFTVPAGSILFEDTRGLHKGTPLIKGERLVLEFIFSNSLFGAIAEPIENANIDDDKKFLAFAKQHQKIFKLYPI